MDERRKKEDENVTQDFPRIDDERSGLFIAKLKGRPSYCIYVEHRKHGTARHSTADSTYLESIIRD